MLRNNESKDDRQASLNKEFLSRVITLTRLNRDPELTEYDFIKCDKWLAEGANINARFGKHTSEKHDALSFCGPNDTPLTYAAKGNHTALTDYLLQHGADTELYNGTDKTALLEVCSRSRNSSNRKMIQLLLEHGANPNAKNHENLTAMHMIFLCQSSWLVDTEKKLATEAVKLLLDAGFIGDFDDITERICKNNNAKNIKTFKQICDEVNMSERLDANKKEYDELKKYIDENHITSGKGLSHKINNILRNQEAAKLFELGKLEKEQKEEEKRLAIVTLKIERIQSVLEQQMKEPMIYNPEVPFHQQAVKLQESGGSANLLGMPYTNKTILFKPVMINGNEYYISLNKKSVVGRDHGVHVHDKLSFEVIDVTDKMMRSDLEPEAIDYFLRDLYYEPMDLAVNNKPQ